MAVPRRTPAPPVPPARLILEAGPTAGARVVPLSRDVVVGRDAGCDVVLDDPRVSARHARLRVRDGTVVVEDLGSAYGTMVNGRAVPSAGVVVSSGDRITFGAVQARVDDPWQRAEEHGPEARSRADETSTPRHVVVSHGRVDVAVVRSLGRALEGAGHEVWVDTGDVPPGTTWREQIAHAIERSDAFVVVLTSRSVASPEVAWEVHLAASLQVPIIPVVVRPVTIPGHLEYPLAGLHRIAVGSGNARRAAREVLKAVERGLPGRPRVSVWHRAARALVAVLALGVVLGTATVVTGAVPPWAPQGRCDHVALQVGPGRPAATSLVAGATFPVRITNRASRAARMPGSDGVRVIGSDGFSYDVQRLLTPGRWFRGFSVAPGATVERSLGIEVPADRARNDSVLVDVGSITEDWLPILRCRAVADGVPLLLAG